MKQAWAEVEQFTRESREPQEPEAATEATGDAAVVGDQVVEAQGEEAEADEVDGEVGVT